MALIRFSNLVNDIRGSSGGNTFSRGLAGATVSMKRTVSVPEGRSFRSKGLGVSPAAKAWRHLSQSSRNSWNEFARNNSSTNKLGMFRRASGFELFTSAKHRLLQLGQSADPLPTLVVSYPVRSYFINPALKSASTGRVRFGITGVPTNRSQVYLVYIGDRSTPSAARPKSMSFALVGSQVSESAVNKLFPFVDPVLAPPSRYLLGEFLHLKILSVDLLSGRLLATQFVSMALLSTT